MYHRELQRLTNYELLRDMARARYYIRYAQDTQDDRLLLDEANHKLRLEVVCILRGRRDLIEESKSYDPFQWTPVTSS